MKYINVNGGNTFLEYDEENHTSRVLIKSDIVTKIEQLHELVDGKELSTDGELLTWAKANYPFSEDIKTVQIKKQELDNLESLCTKLV